MKLLFFEPENLSQSRKEREGKKFKTLRYWRLGESTPV